MSRPIQPPSKASRRQLLQGSIAGALAFSAGALAQGEQRKPIANLSPTLGDGGVSPVMRSFAAYIAQSATTGLPDAVTEATKHHLIDTLAAMISGSRLLPGKKALAYIKAQGGTPEACVPGSKIITTVVNASLAGGMLAHADETDDSHEASLTHPGCGTVPAALAMAEHVGANGVALLRAVALGYDVCVRISQALGAYAFANAGHDTHSFGPMFGAAAAAGSLARLNTEQVRYLLSYTSQQASGLANYQRDTQHIEKAFVYGGMPARDGAASATMVASGMTGLEDAFSGYNNLFFAFKKDANPEALLRELGSTWEVVNTNIKRWTVGSPMQAPLDSLYELIKTNKVKADDVEKVVIRLSHRGVLIVGDATMPDISMQHMAAVMLLDGTVTFASAHDVNRMRDPRVLEVRRRIELVGDDELERKMPKREAIVELTLRDGRVLVHRTVAVRGTTDNPMTRVEVDEKCLPLISDVIGPARARALIDAVWHIEEVRDVRALRPLLMA